MPPHACQRRFESAFGAIFILGILTSAQALNQRNGTSRAAASRDGAHAMPRIDVDLSIESSSIATDAASKATVVVERRRGGATVRRVDRGSAMPIGEPVYDDIAGPRLPHGDAWTLSSGGRRHAETPSRHLRGDPGPRPRSAGRAPARWPRRHLRGPHHRPDSGRHAGLRPPEPDPRPSRSSARLHRLESRGQYPGGNHRRTRRMEMPISFRRTAAPPIGRDGGLGPSRPRCHGAPHRRRRVEAPAPLHRSRPRMRKRTGHRPRRPSPQLRNTISVSDTDSGAILARKELPPAFHLHQAPNPDSAPRPAASAGEP